MAGRETAGRKAKSKGDNIVPTYRLEIISMPTFRNCDGIDGVGIYLPLSGYQDKYT